MEKEKDETSGGVVVQIRLRFFSFYMGNESGLVGCSNIFGDRFFAREILRYGSFLLCWTPKVAQIEIELNHFFRREEIKLAIKRLFIYN